MSGHIYKIIEVTGSSNEGMQQAIESAVQKVAANNQNLRWFEVIETRGQIDQGQVAYWQVTLKIGCTL